jgi:hypothetical protein
MAETYSRYYYVYNVLLYLLVLATISNCWIHGNVSFKSAWISSNLCTNKPHHTRSNNWHNNWLFKLFYRLWGGLEAWIFNNTAVKTSKPHNTPCSSYYFLLATEHQFHSGRHILMQVTSTPRNDKPLSLSSACYRFSIFLQHKKSRRGRGNKNELRYSFV